MSAPPCGCPVHCPRPDPATPDPVFAAEWARVQAAFPEVFAESYYIAGGDE